MQTGKLASPQEVFEGRRERAARPKLGTPINGLVPQAREENEDLHDRGGGAKMEMFQRHEVVWQVLRFIQ